jgi:DNA-binding CsgD family transcriptional regulator
MVKFVENEFPRLLDLLYDAALEPSRWQTFLDALPNSFGNARGVLHSYNLATNTISLLASFGQDPVFSASYVAHYASVNPYPNIGFHKIPVGKVMYASDYISAEAVAGTEFYNDWMRPQGITPDHLGLSLRSDEEGATILSLAPHAAVYARHRRRYTQQFELLAPQIKRAVEINRRTSAVRLAERNLSDTLEALGIPAFLVGRSGQLLLVNTKAETLMRVEGVVIVDKSKKLRAARTDDDKVLSAAIAAAPTAISDHCGQPLRLTSCVSGRGFVAWVLPIRPPHKGTPSCRFELFSGVGPVPVALVLLDPVGTNIAIPAGAIQRLFKLSAAEARLASALAAGHTVDQYANVANLSRNTVRNQLAAVFTKTETNRQTELVGLIVGALGPAAKR